jgi:hypothetical protein
MTAPALTARCAHPPCRQLAETPGGHCCRSCSLWALGGTETRPVPSHDDTCVARTLKARTGAPMTVRAGDEAQCRVCGRWHIIAVPDQIDGKPDVDRMRFLICPKARGQLYIGREGEIYRPEFRRRAKRTAA